MLSYKIREIPDWVFGSIEIDRTTLVSKRYGTSFNGLGFNHDRLVDRDTQTQQRNFCMVSKQGRPVRIQKQGMLDEHYCGRPHQRIIGGTRRVIELRNRTGKNRLTLRKVI